MADIDIQPDDMNLMVFPQRRRLYARQHLQRQRLLADGALRRGDARHAVVIGNRQHADAHSDGALDQRLGRQQPVGGAGMAV